jgi:hypothetical protein
MAVARGWTVGFAPTAARYTAPRCSLPSTVADETKFPAPERLPTDFQKIATIYEVLKDKDVKERARLLDAEVFKYRDAIQATERERAALAKARADHITTIQHEAQHGLVTVVRLLKDAILFGALWTFFYGAHALTEKLPVAGTPGAWINAIHGWGSVVTYLVLAGQAIWDIIPFRRRH